MEQPIDLWSGVVGVLSIDLSTSLKEMTSQRCAILYTLSICHAVEAHSCVNTDKSECFHLLKEYVSPERESACLVCRRPSNRRCFSALQLDTDIKQTLIESQFKVLQKYNRQSIA